MSIYILAIAVLAAAVTAFYGKWRFGSSTELQGMFFAVSTVFNLLEGDSEAFRALFYPSVFWRAWAYFLSVLIPVLTASTVMILIAQHLPQPALRAHTYYIFSHLDAHTLLLAEDIAKHSENCAFFFLRTSPEEIDEDLLLRLHALPHQCFPYTESTLLRHHRRIRRKKLRFFFLSEHTDENFQQMKELLEETKKRNLFGPGTGAQDCISEANKSIYRQELYLLSETSSAPMLIDNLRHILCDETGARIAQFRWTELRLLDRYRALSYELLHQVPLYRTAVNGQNHVLILGFGQVGTAVFRSMVSFSSMVGHHITFTLCDRRIDQNYSAMIQMYPECADGYDVQRLTIDVETCDPEVLLNNPEPSPYTLIVVCLGDDELDVKLAVQLKRYYRKRHWEHKDEIQPFICLNVEDPIKSSYTKELFREPGCTAGDHPLLPFGTDQERFSVQTLMPRAVWTAAQELHRQLKGTPVWDLPCWLEYERRSSIACVCHTPYHIASVSPAHDPGDPEYPLHTAAHAEALIAAEHRRWMDYVRSEGMQYVPLETVLSYYPDVHRYVDIPGQLTPCLVPADQLENLYHQLQEHDMISSNTLTFYQKDRFVIEHAPEFVRLFLGLEK